MTKRDTLTEADVRLIRSALADGIGWQDGLADAYAHVPGSAERKAALAQVDKYRALLKRLSGSARTPMEQLADTLTERVGLSELMAATKGTPNGTD